MQGTAYMHYKTFDTHKYIKSLQETGFNEQQAEVLVRSLLDSRDFDLSILATREQVSNLKADLQKEIAATRQEVADVRTELKQDIADTKNDLLRWMIPLLFGVIGLLVTVMIKLF